MHAFRILVKTVVFVHHCLTEVFHVLVLQASLAISVKQISVFQIHVRIVARVLLFRIVRLIVHAQQASLEVLAKLMPANQVHAKTVVFVLLCLMVHFHAHVFQASLATSVKPILVSQIHA